MVRDAEATKARILAAARSEFAAGGLAGARVDRIAAVAAANKQLIYAYFGSKEALFDAVIAQVVGGLVGDVPFDADDLPGYAVALYDYGLAHPDLIRLARWHSQERPGVLPGLPGVLESTRLKLSTLAERQRAGSVRAEPAARYLLEQVLALVHSGNDGVFAEFVPAAGGVAAADDAGRPDVADVAREVDERRAALRRSVELLTRPE